MTVGNAVVVHKASAALEIHKVVQPKLSSTSYKSLLQLCMFTVPFHFPFHCSFPYSIPVIRDDLTAMPSFHLAPSPTACVHA